LRNLAHEPAIDRAFPDGIVYFDATAQSVDDLLQQIFEAFFESDRPFKPDATQLRTMLARLSPLVMLDGGLFRRFAGRLGGPGWHSSGVCLKILCEHTGGVPRCNAC
ncbi:MAG TPA: hypothetical protein VIG47_02805, partial [Gemmatimonadaceae bacterium]